MGIHLWKQWRGSVVATQEGIADFFDPDKTPISQRGSWLTARSKGCAAIQATHGRQELREEIIKSARELAFEKYDWDLITEEMRNKMFSARRAEDR